MSERASRALGRLVAVTLAALVLLVVPVLAKNPDFPGAPPDPSNNPATQESPRANTPDDPDFDPCETDESDAGDDAPAVNGEDDDCKSYFSEQFGLFGFNPDSANTTPPARTPPQYANCPGPGSQLDAQGRDANVKAGDLPCSQISGVRADSAWKYSAGSPETVIAILDTGIEWQDQELVSKVRLNRQELPEPNANGTSLVTGQDCADFTQDEYDRNNDGAFNVLDYACDNRVEKDGGDTESDSILDASDLIAEFSDDDDDDGNGYEDDIAGWDFFDDDNDPFDASSCCSADGHGTGRAREAAAQTNNAKGRASLCPECQIMPLRVWDTFVVDTNFFALGTLYATDNGADVVEGAVGGLLNSQFARRSFRYADEKGVALTLVSSDINSANHNYPTNYNEAIYVAGSLPDSAPGEQCEIPGFPGFGDVPGSGEFGEGCDEFLAFLESIPGPLGGVAASISPQPPTTSFFRNSNLTQYAGKADIVLVGSTGSENTGQASGAAGLLESYARDEQDYELSGNEIRQLLTMSAEDVMPENTGTIGLPDSANKGWDSHFGYGRVNLAGAMAMIQADRIPPEAQLDAPDWFAPINVDKVGAGGVQIKGRVRSPRFDNVNWKVQYRCGQDAKDSDFTDLPGASGGTDRPPGSVLGTLSKGLLTQLADTCDGQVANDAGRPAGNPSQPGAPWPADPYPDPDPERHAFQIRLIASEAGATSPNVGEYRKTLFAYRDDGTLAGWPKPIGSGSVPGDLITGSGGETSPRFVDLDADNQLDVILPTTSGEVHVLRPNGTPLPAFNGGQPVRTQPYAGADAHADAAGIGVVGKPLEAPRVPAVGDITGDGEPEIVATAGERVYAWHRDGDEVEGFPQRIDPDLSEPCEGGAGAKPCFDAANRLITHEHHIKRGFFGSPALADLDSDGELDIVAGSLDQHVYAWDGEGNSLSGFPAELDSEGEENGAEIVTTPTIADLDGNGDPEVVIATNEVLEADPGLPEGFGGFLSAVFASFTGSSVTYALHGDGEPVTGWPVRTGVLAGDILPLVVPSHDAAAGDLQAGAGDELAISAATGPARLIAGNGSPIRELAAQPAPGPASSVFDPSFELNLADYPSIGRLSGSSPPSVIKGGLSLNGAANLLAVNQNLPFNHTLQAWNPQTGQYLPRYPVATDDFQLLSQPVIAKVDGSGTGRQALVGTGLYQLHAYGADGSEPKGGAGPKDDWPKFTGGWTQPMPTVGDLNGDGKLDVMALTREGWSFVWSTDAPECRTGSTTTNEEWWTFHHDEFSTANYGTDARPPSRPGALAVTERSNGDLRIAFASSGDDLRCGDATRYEVRGSDGEIEEGEDFEQAQPIEATSSGASAADAGQPTALVAENGARFENVAIRAVDDAGNVSYIRAETAARQGDDGGGGNGDGNGDGDGDGGGGGGGAGAGGAGDGTGGLAGADTGTLDEGDDDGSLPFTGLALALLVLIALLLGAGGLALRRRLSR